MSRRLMVLMVALLATAGCSAVSGSRLNPFNWFGRSEEVAVSDAAPAHLADPRPLIDQVTALTVDPTPGGAILRATGLPPTQGYYDAALVSVSDDEPVDGVLEYRFVAFPPATPARVSTPQSREIVVGRVLSRQDLAGVTEIRVTAAQNARAVRR